MKKTAIMGFGNPVRSDDAIGCYVIEKLKEAGLENETVSLFDMGTGAFEVLFKLLGHEKIIIVDAVINTGEPAGTLYKVPASEIQSAIQDDPMVFLHSIKWDQALSYTRKIMQENYPEDITVYLISVDDTRLDIHLSPQVRTAGEQVIEFIKDDVFTVS